ncbi:hypothetical protein, partial [Glycomyces dulcitolivorans]|uniref:hypothetical protein n=1 Tax=Glycomyces dulcitolivorans TaxID=2200759 RepID=UPI00130073DB
WAAAFAAYLRARLASDPAAALAEARRAKAGFRDAGDRRWELRAEAERARAIPEAPQDGL